MAAADQTTDPDGGVGADAEALIRSLGVSAGDRLDGRYRLERVLHTTGPAVTWLAADEKLNRPSRIHLLRADQPRAEAFMAAARAAAAMADNHFVQVLDAVPDDGLYYVITEWLHDGHTLGEVLAGGPVPIHEAVRITTELARAMAEAHDQGLAHLRLSPKTVLRTDTGEVKILDLCLAAALTGTVSRDPLGTDLGAIGELAYALLTGKRPQAQPAPPSELRPEISPQLDEVVLRILGDESAGPAFQTPTEVADALARLPRPRYEAPLPSTPQTAPLRHQQTTVMPASAITPTTAMPQAAPNYQAAAPSYQNAPARPAPHAAPGGHGAHSGPRRPSTYEDDYPARGNHGGSGGGGRSSSAMIGVGALAAVVAIALLAYTMFGGDKNKGNPSGAGSSSQTTKSSAPSTSATAAAADLPYTGVTLYDSDDGTEGKGYLSSGQIGSKGWFTSQYCQNYATVHGDQKSTGLIFNLGSAKTVSNATVTIGTAGAAMEMWAADPSVTAAPAIEKGKAPTGFKQVASATADSTTVTLKASAPVSTQFVLIWFTKPLPAAPAPDKSIPCAHDDGNRYGDSISAVKFNTAS